MTLHISLDVTLKAALRHEVPFYVHCYSYDLKTTTNEVKIYESRRGDGNFWKSLS